MRWPGEHTFKRGWNFMINSCNMGKKSTEINISELVRNQGGWDPLPPLLSSKCSLAWPCCVFTSMWPYLCTKKKMRTAIRQTRMYCKNSVIQRLVFRSEAVSNTKSILRMKLLVLLYLILWNMHNLHVHCEPPRLGKPDTMCLFPLHGPVEEFTFTHCNRWF